ncbi:uncharacterized protein LOC121916384 isoform X2 [Sceloporus undulatus]|uniref:uncharacterized protein LOC121916384 isoform X2 n=1 Tax=Sceloporus undulatus TaxID=8520 RepID=UPI001C4C46D3|nr:uncharacterized protein LOC121916384 isoform X2 [Sceloporus undulatus]
MASSEEEPRESAVAAAAGATTAPLSLPPPSQSGIWAKDHCDYLLDSIDAQLSRLQAQGPTKGNSSNGAASLDGSMGVSKADDLGRSSGDGDGEASPVEEDSASQMEEGTRWQAHCLDLEGNLESQSRSDSVCTEDLAATFQAGLVDLPLSSDSEGEEDVFVLTVIPGDILQSQAESTNPSQTLADSESALDSARNRTRALSLQAVLRPEWGQDSLAPCSEEPPSPCARCRIWSLESLGEKFSLLSQKDSKRRKGLQPQRILNLGELGGSIRISGEKAFWEPGQRSKTFEVSSEWAQDLHENSSRPLHVGDLDPWPPLEVDAKPVKMPGGVAPTRTVQPCPPEKGEAGLVDPSCLCALPGSHSRCGAPSGGNNNNNNNNNRRGVIPPEWHPPLTTCRTGKMQRGALSRLRSTRGGTHGPLGFPSHGCLEPCKNCTEGHGEALKPMESIKVSFSPRRDLLRSFGSRDKGAEEEEELARLCHGGTCGTSRLGKQSPCQAADPIWKAALLGPYRGCELRPSQECRDGLQTKDLALEWEALQDALDGGHKEARRLTFHLQETQSKVDEIRADLIFLDYKREASLRELLALEKELSAWRRQGSQDRASQAQVSHLAAEREELKAQVEQLEERLSSLKLQLKSSKAELASVKETADKMKQLQETALSEKESELSRLRKIISVLEAEKEAQSSAVERLREEQTYQLEALQREAQQEKEKNLLWLREELQREKRQELQEVQTALLQEQKKWEADARAALQLQRQALQKQNQRAQMDLQAALEGEQKTSLALQGKNASLHMRIEKLESQVQALQREKKVAMEELQEQLQKEKVEALKRLQEELEQERMHKRDQTRVKVQQMEEDHRLLQAELRERESQAHDGWAQEVALACQQLQDLLPKKAGGPVPAQMLHGSPALLPCSHLLQALQGACREIQLYLQDLKQETKLQRQDILQLRREKECELRQQQERLHRENQLALEALKGQLVQEHLEDIAALQRSWFQEASAKEDRKRGPPQASRETDGKLQATERSAARWREQLACEFKEELNAELEKHRSRDKAMEFLRDQEMPESEIQPFSMGSYPRPPPCCSRWINATAAFSSPRHFTPRKLLRRLQSRIQELRAENAAYGGASLDNLGGFRGDLPDTCGTKRQLAAGFSSSLPHRSSNRK